MNKDEALKIIESAEWLADKIVAQGDYAKEACLRLKQLAQMQREALAQPAQEPAYIYDLEAISWALDKLANFGVTQNSIENALMANRLQFMLYQAPDTHPAPAREPLSDDEVKHALLKMADNANGRWKIKFPTLKCK